MNDAETEYHGQVVGLSQRDKRIFRTLKVIGRRKILWGAITVFKIEVPAADLEQVIRRLQENMSTKVLFISQEFYAHFYRGSQLVIVFRDRVFRATTDRTTWTTAIAHGREMGIRERQLDFSPCRFEDETY